MTGKGKNGVCALTIAALSLFVYVAFTASAGAAVGQLESWGSFGFGQKQFAEPSMFGVDPSDGSVYVGDVTQNHEFFRIQKFSGAGTFEASLEIARYKDPGTNSNPVFLWGIAVDPVLHRFYVLEGGKEKEAMGGETVAKKILVFSTIPSAGKLVAPEGGPSSLPVPTGANFVEGLFKPRGIQVDPNSHDVIVMAENKASPKRTQFQRVSSAGVIGAKFTDSGNVLRPANENAISFAVAPNGTIYTVTGRHTAPAKEHTKAWEVPSSFASVSQVPGFATAINSEESPFGVPTVLVPLPQRTTTGGPEIAISPDGGTLYWKEINEPAAESGNVLVRGFSLTGLATTVVYGGGAKEQCQIETPGALLGTVGEKVVVLDNGPLVEAVEPKKPAYGDKVLTFGPGGSNCPVPAAKFKANGSEGNIKIKKGETVSFDASSSELASGPAKTPGFRKELIWDFGDGTKETITGSGGGEAPATTTHKYTTPGTFKATLQIRLKNPTYGNPVLVEHSVEAENGTPEPQQLNVTPAGTGSGTVTSNPAGISCGGTCQANFAEGALVKLTGTPTAGSKPVAWTGCDAVTAGVCEVTMSAAKNVTATFDLEQHQLKVTPAGTGSGTVTSSPAGISCGGTCEFSFDHNLLVKLTGAPNPGSKPVAWTGCDAVTAGVCEVTMSAAKNVTATFDVQQRQLTVTPAGTGSGTVTSNPAGISCGGTCQANFAEGALVKLTGTPTAGSKPVAWTGCDAVTAGVCEVTMSAAKNVTATFDLEQHQLKVTPAGTGSGTVTSNPAGISCGGTCQASFAHGLPVKLSASSQPNTEPVAWTGCDNVNGSNECEVTMSAAKNVTATFTPKTPLLSVILAGSGSGSVESAPAGIACGATCSHTYAYNTLVKLTGTPTAGSKAVVWSGCDAVNGSNQCEVTMTAAKDVTAAFSLANLNSLIVTPAGSGSGTVASSPAGIDCGGECAHDFAEGTLVKLIGTPAAGSKAVVWFGCDAVNAGACEVTMSAAKNVTATFDLQQRQLTVTPAGTGSGTVTSNPAGINCGATCQASFAEGQLVQLTGTPAAGSKAVAWTGCDAVTSGVCEVTMSAAKGVTATFDLVTQRQLKVVATGSGTVTSSPAGINCGATCQANFDDGTLVKLTGAPGSGSAPVVWTQCPGTVNGSNQCEVTMDAAKEAKATFAQEQRLLTVTPAGTGSGTVTSNPAGINCGATCQASFAEGQLVQLTGIPAAGSKAVAWTGCDAVTSGVCEVTMSAAKGVTATFDREPHQLKVTTNGTGSGTVTSNPAGINCGATCQVAFADGTVVTLTAVSGVGSKAVVWQGCASNPTPSECTVTLDAAEEVKATFDVVPQRQLSVAKAGTGSGTVTSNPAGINCGATCQATFTDGALLKLAATPAPGSEPATWAGCDTVNGSNECEVTMSAAKGVTATFDLQQLLLTVNKSGAGAGTGTVTSAPGGISCGVECSKEFAFATEVTLTAVVGAGTGSVAWAGCASEPTPTKCSVTMSAAKNVTATFVPTQGHLVVAKAGSGAGFVASSPARIGCGGTCQGSFDLGSVVTLAGVAGSGSKEVFWGGCDRIVGANRCEVTVRPDTRISAGFDLIATGSEDGAQPPAEEPDTPAKAKPKQSAKQKAIARCRKKFKPGKARSRCVRKANKASKASRANGGRR